MIHATIVSDPLNKIVLLAIKVDICFKINVCMNVQLISSKTKFQMNATYVIICATSAQDLLNIIVLLAI